MKSDITVVLYYSGEKFPVILDERIVYDNNTVGGTRVPIFYLHLPIIHMYTYFFIYRM